MSGKAWWRTFGEGVVVQLANPKAAVFMIAFYPQFVPADRPLFATTAGLAAVQVVIETGFYLTLAYGVGRAGAFFRRSKVRRRLDAIAGTVLVGLGVRVAVSSSLTGEGGGWPPLDRPGDLVDLDAARLPVASRAVPTDREAAARLDGPVLPEQHAPEKGEGQQQQQEEQLEPGDQGEDQEGKQDDQEDQDDDRADRVVAEAGREVGSAIQVSP